VCAPPLACRSTYNRILKESEGFWLFERAQLIQEFKDTKPPLPPPFNVLWLLLQLPAVGRRWCSTTPPPLHTRGFKHVPDVTNLRRYRKREQQALKQCLSTQQQRRAATVAARSERQEEAFKRLEEMNRSRFETINGRLDKLSGKIGASRPWAGSVDGSRRYSYGEDAHR
jgi:hypothetical protein